MDQACPFFLLLIQSQPMLTRSLIASFLLLIAEVPLQVSAQDTLRHDSLDYYDMSLEQLQSLKAHGVPSELEKLIDQLISVASKKPLSTRESPSIVSLITAEEIANAGARDLIDVLRLVPGMDFGVDVEGVVGLGMRGNWVHEGKALLLLDGQEMNEIMFATTQFGNHFPVDQIKKIEIIRGPGSAIYGGFAEYCVINIITKSGADLDGISVTGTYGQMQSDLGRRNINIMGGKKINDFEFSLAGFAGQGNRSDRDYTDIYGTTYNMAGNSDLNPMNLNLGMSYKGLSFRGIADLYSISVRDAYDAVKDSPYRQDFESYYAEIKYVKKFSDRITVTPRINYKKQVPWKTLDVDSLTPDYYRVAERYTASVIGSYNFTRRINLSAGAEAFQDKARDLSAEGYFSDSVKDVKYFNQGYFMQALAKTRIVNLILGARYDIHNIYGAAFVPRVGFTKKIRRVNFKFLWTNAFRAPSIENIDLSPIDEGIKPEKTSVLELETGYQFTRKSFFTFNFFDVTTKDPIVYYYDDSLGTDNYHNFGASGSRGFEAEYRIKDKWGYVTLNYAFYTVAGKEKIDDYSVSENENVLLAFPNHKVNLGASVNITKDFSVNVTGSLRGTTYGYTSVDTAGEYVLSTFDPVVLVNVYLRYNNFLTPGLCLGAGVYDALNQGTWYIQPYNGGHAPLPGPSREFVFKLSYDLHFKKKEGAQ
jgi:outer membrane receptor for ferrienterochelin and colicin